jgi:hypothetical protein
MLRLLNWPLILSAFLSGFLFVSCAGALLGQTAEGLDPQTIADRAMPPIVHHYGSGRPASRDTSQYFGGVTCQAGVPVIFYDRDQTRDSLQRAETIRHEAMHFVQLATGDCVTTLGRWASDPRAFLAAEMEAFCAGIAQLPPARQHARRQEYLLLFGGPRRPYGISFEDVAAAILNACGTEK